MEIKEILVKVFDWIIIFTIFWLFVSALGEPMIHWKWGFYNYEMLATIGILLSVIIFKTYWNTIKLRQEIKNLKVHNR